MSTWVDVVQTLSGPAIAAGAVVYTNRRNDRRESGRWDDERTERRNDRWREERKAAHAALLLALSTVESTLREAYMDWHYRLEARAKFEAGIDQAEGELGECWTALATVDLIGSSESKRLAREVVAHWAQTQAAGILMPLDGELGKMHEIKFTEGVDALIAQRDRYLEAARRDLGTD